MSRDVFSVGYMAPLNRKLTNREVSEWEEILYDRNSNVHFNYEGTLAYTAVEQDAYGIWFDNEISREEHSFSDLIQFGIYVDEYHVRAYRCMWYNGGDSPMSMMTLEDFNAIQKG